MSKRNHALRNLAVRLNVSGTVEVLEEQRLYKDSYGFIKLQAYVPKTQNTEAPVCTVFCTTIDELGREKISSKNHDLLYVGEVEMDGAGYLLFEQYLPKEFTKTVTPPNGLKITFNYYDTAPTLDEEGNPILGDNGLPMRHATNLLVSSRYTTTVHPGGWNNEDVELGVNAETAAQIAENMRDIDKLQEEVSGLKNVGQEAAEAAKYSAEAAAKYASDAKNAAESAEATVDFANETIEAIKKEVLEFESYVDETLGDVSIDADDLGLEQDEETGYVYPTYKGVRSLNGIYIAGGGGGGGAVTYAMTLTNLLDNRSFSVNNAEGAILKFSYSSIDSDGENDGTGLGTLYVGGVKVLSFNMIQGDNELNVGNFLVAGSNTVKVSVENTEGLRKTLTYTITLVSLTITTTFDEFTVNTGSVTLYYTPTGSGTKTIHFVMDDVEIDTATVVSSGRTQSYVIPAQTHGAHYFKIYATVMVDGSVAQSNTVTLGMIWLTSENTEPIILSEFKTTSCLQGEILSIPYFVYDPSVETATVTLSILDESGNTYSSQTLSVGRVNQTWVTDDYPTGNIVFRISVGETTIEYIVSVTDSGSSFERVTDNLVLFFDPTGRNNNVENPAQWTDGVTVAQFSGVGFAGADGWLTDDAGSAVLRLLPGGTMMLPLSVFTTDKRVSGFSVEVEMATHNVRDYNAVVLSCLSGGRGFQIAAQNAEFVSEQTSISMQFKEDERVRISFVVEPKNLNRLIYVYVNSILCGAIQYPDDDNFSQNPAVGITIGSESSGIDIYKVYVYEKSLAKTEILENFIADRPTLQDRQDAQTRNDILDDSDEIVVSKLPSTLPYMVISCPELPQYKGDKKTNVEITYVDLSAPTRSFTASGVEMDVQGTSSAGYKKKNFKIKLAEGLTYTIDGTSASKYQLRSDSMPEAIFCMKADVASSEGANNVELVRLYNDMCPYKTAAQQEDERVRVGIDGVPCVVFWQNTTTMETRFWGKYNFNNDKSTEDLYGLTDGCESWEILNNTSNRVIFKTSSYTSGWENDFEARYPDGNTDYTNLKRLTDWLVSTNRTGATTSTAATRLQTFKDEFEDYFVKEPMLFYYLFTEVFLMVDSRAKNLFLTTYDGIHWMPLPYDMDTALGINNEGQLVFEYDLEDTDTVNGSNVFNGQTSTLWCNIRDAFADELKDMYITLRSGPFLNYDNIIARFSEHQSVWPEAVWNEDAYEKYLEPLLTDNDSSYLTMLQGNKASQRAWWLYNGLRYRDSKYETGEAESQFITLRCYAKANIAVKPYSHIMAKIKYGSYTVKARAKCGVSTTLTNPLSTMSDTEVYIYSADRISELGDLSTLQVGYANFSMATKLSKLKLGSSASSYNNTHLTELYVGNNDLLGEIDLRNCSGLTGSVDLSGCTGLETLYAAGTNATAFKFSVGGKLKTVQLPATITNLTIQDQMLLESFSMAGYANVATLRVENSPIIPIEDIIGESATLSRVRLVNVEWTATDTDSLKVIIDKLKTCGGLDSQGYNTDSAVVIGKVHINRILQSLLDDININFPNLIVDYGEIITSTYGIYGVAWVNDESVTMTRTDDAVGMNFTINSSSGRITSDFNNVFPWCDATIETDSAGNKFKHIPAMWFRISTDEDGNLNGVAVAKERTELGDWYYVNDFCYGCYGAGMNEEGTALVSKSGIARKASATRSQFRSYAAAAGSGYQQLDLKHNTIMMFLWWIEWATKDSASIMTGRISGSGTLGGATVRPTGGTDTVLTQTGFEPKYGQMKWHDIEDFIGNLLEWVDGATWSTRLYVTADSSLYSDSVTNFVLWGRDGDRNKVNGSTLAFGWDDSQPFLIWSVKNNADDTAYVTGFCDVCNNTDSTSACVSAGATYYNAYAIYGLCSRYRYSSTFTNTYIGGRLLKIA